MTTDKTIEWDSQELGQSRGNNIKSVIDVGTNSIKLCAAIADENAPRGCTVIHDEIKVTRLGSELKTPPCGRSLEALREFAAKARGFNAGAGAGKIRAVGTAALRDSPNAGAFRAAVRDDCGIEIEVISGEREAQLSYNAAAALAGGRNCVVFDAGGGSVELISGENKLSLPFGVLSVHERYFLNDPASASAEEAVSDILKVMRGSGFMAPASGFSVPASGIFVIGIGGTVTAMAAVKLKLLEFRPETVSGTMLDMSDVESQIRLYQGLSPEERAGIPGLSADRADIILAGACIVGAVMRFFGGAVAVSADGLRHALLSEMFGR